MDGGVLPVPLLTGALLVGDSGWGKKNFVVLRVLHIVYAEAVLTELSGFSEEKINTCEGGTH